MWSDTGCRGIEGATRYCSTAPGTTGRAFGAVSQLDRGFVNAGRKVIASVYGGQGIYGNGLGIGVSTVVAVGIGIGDSVGTGAGSSGVEGATTYSGAAPRTTARGPAGQGERVIIYADIKITTSIDGR